MDRRKLESAALFLTILGAMLIMPPLAVVFQIERRFFGLPAEVIYLFLAWAALVASAWWLGKRLPREPEADSREDDA
jgi:hypothetical protein